MNSVKELVASAMEQNPINTTAVARPLSLS